MKIVLVGPVFPYRGGISHFNTQLSHGLLDRGHDVHIYSFRRQYPDWLYPGVTDKEVGSSVVPVEAQYTLDPMYPWTWVKTASMIEDIAPEVVIIHWWTTFWSLAYWSLVKLLQRSNHKIIYIIHNVAPHEPMPWDNWLARNVLNLGESHIVQSPNEKQRLEELIPGLHPVLCPHPVYNQFYGDKALTKDEARRQLGLKNDGPIVLFFGIVRPYKGLIYALQAISILNKEGISIRMLVAGEFWEQIEVYEGLIIQLGITDQILIYNRYIPNEEVSLFFSAADVFIAPYTGGTQSGSVKIAMSFNLPIIATDRISDDIMLESEFVHTVPSEDSQALSEAIKELIVQESPEIPNTTAPDTSWVDLITAIENLVDQNLEIKGSV